MAAPSREAATALARTVFGTKLGAGTAAPRSSSTTCSPKRSVSFRQQPFWAPR
jgi:hypothetical protein